MLLKLFTRVGIRVVVLVLSYKFSWGFIDRTRKHRVELRLGRGRSRLDGR